MRNRNLSLLILCALTLTLIAGASGQPIVTADPATSAAYPVGSSFEPGEVSQTTDPLGPFSGIPIEFRGWGAGGSQVCIGGGAPPL